MDGFKFIFQYQEPMKFNMHPSYLTQFREQLLDNIEKRLIKQGFQNGEFHLTIQIRQLECSSYPSSFMISVAMSDNCSGRIRWLGFFDVSAWDKDWGVKPKVLTHNSDWLLNTMKDISDKSVEFKIEHDNLFPSMEKYQEQTRRQTEKFINTLKAGFRFPCELNCDWPDVIFEVFFPNESTEQIANQAEAVFCDFMEKWNKQQEKKDGEETIHYIANVSDNIENPKQNVVYIHVDFGNSSIIVLQKLLQHLNKSNLNIEKIILS